MESDADVLKTASGATVTPPPQHNYLQQDVHVNVMLRHNLPDVPFDSRHQQKHLLVVDGLGGDDPVYRFT